MREMPNPNPSMLRIQLTLLRVIHGPSQLTSSSKNSTQSQFNIHATVPPIAQTLPSAVKIFNPLVTLAFMDQSSDGIGKSTQA